MSIQTRWSGYSAQDPQNRPAVPEGAGRRRSARLRSLATGDFRRLGLQFRHVVAGGSGKVFRQGAIHTSGQLSGQLRELLLVGGEFLVPCVLRFSPRGRIPARVDLFRDLERRIFPAKLLAG